jgi:hypothetical protein
MFLVVWKYAQMNQSTFFTTPYIKKYLLKKLNSGGLKVCANAAKLVFNHFSCLKISGCLEVCANASKHVYYQFVRTCFYPHQTLKNIFFKNLILVVWKYAQMRKNTFITTPYIKNYLFKNLIMVFLKYAQMHQNTYITTSDVKKYLF